MQINEDPSMKIGYHALTTVNNTRNDMNRKKYNLKANLLVM